MRLFVQVARAEELKKNMIDVSWANGVSRRVNWGNFYETAG